MKRGAYGRHSLAQRERAIAQELNESQACRGRRGEGGRGALSGTGGCMGGEVGGWSGITQLQVHKEPHFISSLKEGGGQMSPPPTQEVVKVCSPKRRQ